MELLPAFDSIDNSVLILYHHGCTDGLVSALIAIKYYIEQEFTIRLYGVSAGSLPIDLLIKSYPKNLIIRFVDLAINKSDYDALSNHFDDLIILDHHETTYKSCIENNPDVIKSDLNTIGLPNGTLYQYNKLCYSLERSGASLAWEHWYPVEAVPDLVRYVQDRDTWKFELPDSKVINQGIFESIGLEFDKTERVIDSLKSLLKIDNIKIESLYEKKILKTLPKFGPYMELLIKPDFDKMKEIGQLSIERVDRIIKYLASTAKVVKWRNYRVYMVNSNLYISELSTYLYNTISYSDKDESNDEKKYVCDLVLVWRYDNQICHVSLRSLSNVGPNVAEIAESYKGGGHKHAAGFKVPLETMVEILKGD